MTALKKMTTVTVTLALLMLAAHVATADLLDDIEVLVPGAADKLDDVREKLDKALEEFTKDPPDLQAALGNLEGAVGDLEAAMKDELSGSAEAIKLAKDLLVELYVLARFQIVLPAIQDAIAGGGDADKIAEAQELLAEADALFVEAFLAAEWTGKFKDAFAALKDALSKAEGA